MALFFNEEEMMELMKDFYTLTGIRIILADETYRELLSYPPPEKSLCFCLHANPSFEAKCLQSNEMAFGKCKRTQRVHVFQCHAGLSEAAAPILENGHIIGYMMFGQVTNNRDKEKFTAQMQEICREYGIGRDLTQQIRRIKYRSDEQLRAASKLLEAFVHYVRLKEIVQPSGQKLIDRLDDFVERHLSEELGVDRICRELDISRTRLYEMVHPYINGGISAYIKSKRLEHARTLIRTTEMSIREVATACGFSDYNYFLRLFKQRFGVSSRRLRKEDQSVDA